MHRRGGGTCWWGVGGWRAVGDVIAGPESTVAPSYE